jgi:CheY-like chemotaxis protein
MLPILIVDDSNEDLLLAERALRSCKLLNPTHRLTSGAECISYFEGRWTAKDGEKAQPCLLLLDLVMAPISGLEVLRKIRDTSFFDESVVVMLSGISDIKMVTEGYQLGARTFLVKPLNPQDILEFVGSVKDKIQIEQVEQGYILHSVFKTQHSAGEVQEFKRTNRIVSLPA